MKRNLFHIKIIGCGLAILYAVSFLGIWEFLRIPELKIRIAVFSLLFGCLFIGSIGIVTLKEWGRELVVGVNVLMFLGLLIHFTLRMGIIPIAYIFMTIIIFLYFNQSKIRLQFYRKNIGGWKSILVVDQDEAHINTIRPFLVSYGFSVLTAQSGEEGLQVAKTQKPELIISEAILPGMKGREFCRKLKEDQETKDIPVMFLSSKDSPEDIQAQREAGAIAHFKKPASTKDLIETISTTLKLKS